MVFQHIDVVGKIGRQLKRRLKEIEIELREVSFAGEASGVRVKVNGAMEMMEIKINPQTADEDDVEELQKFILEACLKACRKAKRAAKKRVDEVMRELGLPRMFD